MQAALAELTLPRSRCRSAAGPPRLGLVGDGRVIGTEASIFAYLLFSYFYVGSQSPGLWPPRAACRPCSTLALPTRSCCC